MKTKSCFCPLIFLLILGIIHINSSFAQVSSFWFTSSLTRLMPHPSSYYGNVSVGIIPKKTLAYPNDTNKVVSLATDGNSTYLIQTRNPYTSVSFQELSSCIAEDCFIDGNTLYICGKIPNQGAFIAFADLHTLFDMVPATFNVLFFQQYTNMSKVVAFEQNGVTNICAIADSSSFVNVNLTTNTAKQFQYQYQLMDIVLTDNRVCVTGRRGIDILMLFSHDKSNLNLYTSRAYNTPNMWIADKLYKITPYTDMTDKVVVAFTGTETEKMNICLFDVNPINLLAEREVNTIRYYPEDIVYNPYSKRLNIIAFNTATNKSYIWEYGAWTGNINEIGPLYSSTNDWNRYDLTSITVYSPTWYLAFGKELNGGNLLLFDKNIYDYQNGGCFDNAAIPVVNSSVVKPNTAPTYYITNIHYTGDIMTAIPGNINYSFKCTN